LTGSTFNATNATFSSSSSHEVALISSKMYDNKKQYESQIIEIKKQLEVAQNSINSLSKYKSD